MKGFNKHYSIDIKQNRRFNLKNTSITQVKNVPKLIK